ncbi:MAG: Fic family protein [Bacilli bacterium]|nr:Fic family protein [Bacilli bacterium]
MENKYSNKYIIETGIGLQDVDRLKNSSYFINESERYIRGEITLSELEGIIASYYKSKPSVEARSEEADIVSLHIAKILSDDSFSFTVGQLISIHKQLFSDVFDRAGKLRTYNFTKKEWVLDGATVWYGDYRELEATLQYDFDLERKFSYSGLSMDGIIDHLSIFLANLWQIHAFEEGNTRTTAVFAIKYLRSLGFDATNETFAKNAWYFRNALVRANYANLNKGIVADRSYLIRFLRNLLLNENNPLHNKELHIKAAAMAESPNKETRVVELMKSNPKIKAEEIADFLGVSLRTVKSLIAVLRENGRIKREGGRKSGYWVVVQKGL